MLDSKHVDTAVGKRKPSNHFYY